jgi:hypothetical protein
MDDRVDASICYRRSALAEIGRTAEITAVATPIDPPAIVFP